ncbi:MAG: 3-deoxy-8-phosphooctulonate synthase [Syntrophales bacterium]|jgi:2-dehydro-3-deoxyphosphooctonate aldolase (KDO 8-P synthase)
MRKTKAIELKGITIGGGAPFVLIAGPCVIEDENLTLDIAAGLKKITADLGIPLIFKASYDKANRTSGDSFRGPGLARGLAILQKVKETTGLPVLSDVHRFEEIVPAAAVLDIMQVPAFLCRQTDFIAEVARHACVVNIKKGQFLAPWDVIHAIRKAEAAGNNRIIITERGTSFGYNNLVADFRSLPIMREFGCPIIFDATHSVQRPGGAGFASGGDREMVPSLSRAAVAVGVDGLFWEVHPDPDSALCDGPNSLKLGDISGLLHLLKDMDRMVKNTSTVLK